MCKVRTNYKTGIQPLHTRLRDQQFLDTSDYSGDKQTHWRSVPSRSAMLAKIDDLNEGHFLWRTDRRATTARELVRRELEIRQDEKLLTPLSLEKAYETLPRDTSPGMPLTRFTNFKKRDLESNTIHVCKTIIRQTMHGWGDYRFPPCILASRLQLCKVGENKPRMVWVYPVVVSLFEQCFAVPLVTHWKKSPVFAWHVNYLRGALPGFVRQLRDPSGGANFGVDFSHFDRSVVDKAIVWAFGLCKSMFKMTMQWHHRVWNAVVKFFIYTPMLAYEWLIMTCHSVPSGSSFTQIIDTLVDFYLITDTVLAFAEKRFVSARPGFDIRNIRTLSEIVKLMKLLGDDSIVKLHFGLLSSDEVAIIEYMKDRHNADSHPSKGFFSPAGYFNDPGAEPTVEVQPVNSENPEFLGKTIVSERDCTINFDILKAQCYIPESKDTCPGDVATRIVGLAWSHGTFQRYHIYLESKWKELHNSYPELTPTPWKRDFIRFFKYVEGVSPPPTCFPKYNEIVDRYRYPGKCKLRNLRSPKESLGTLDASLSPLDDETKAELENSLQ